MRFRFSCAAHYSMQKNTLFSYVTLFNKSLFYCTIHSGKDGPNEMKDNVQMLIFEKYIIQTKSCFHVGEF